MDNYEKYRKQIIDIIINCISYCDAIKKLAGNIDCMSTNCNDCRKNLIEWFDKEYKEPEIDWPEVPIDTPVFVSENDKNCDGPNTVSRHYYGFSEASYYPYGTYADGGTSFSKKEKNAEFWKYCRLAREEDIEKYKI